jgi:transcriptional regulator with XRE-family HTH domain
MDKTKRFKYARESAGLSINQVAKLADIPKETILKYENGEISINSNPFLKHYFANMFKASPEWMGGEDICLPEEAHNVLEKIKPKIKPDEYLKLVELMQMMNFKKPVKS